MPLWLLQLVRNLIGSPLKIGIVYLVLIPIFGIVYWRLPNQFYHSTSQHEPETFRLYDSLRMALQSDIRKLGRIEVASLTIEWVDFSNAELYLLTDVGTQLDLSMMVQQRTRSQIDSFESAPLFLGVSYDTLVDGTPLLFVGVTRFSNGEERILFSESYLLNRKTYDLWLLRINALRGFPSGRLSHAIQMIYFSAVTISTLGYGDIVPLSNCARILVTIEAILGIVLVGLFVNAVFRKSTRDSV